MRLIPNTVKAHKVITAVVAVILCGAAVAAIVTTNSSSRASYFTAPVSTATIRSTIATSGTVVPRTAVGLNFNVAGVVKTVSVHPGQKVSAGQILASLDTTSLQSAVTGATTSLMEDEARLSLDEAGAPASSLTAAQSSVTSAQIQLSSARQALESTYQGGKENLALSQQALTAAADKITTDKSSLTTDESIAQNWCTNDPSSSECSDARSTVTSAAQLVQSDQQVLVTDQSQVADTQVKNAQTLQTLQESVTSAQGAITNAQTALSDTEAENTQNLASANDTLQAAQSNESTANSTLAADYSTEAQLLLACETAQTPVGSSCTASNGGSNYQSYAQSVATSAQAQSQVTSEAQAVTQATQQVTATQVKDTAAQDVTQEALNGAQSALQNDQTAYSQAQSAAASALNIVKLSSTQASQKVRSDQATLALDHKISSGGCAAQPSSSECVAAQATVTSAEQALQSDQLALQSAQSQVPATRVKNAQAVQQAQATITADVANLASARRDLAVTKAGATPQQISIDEATIQGATSVLSADQAQLAQGTIVAPVAGTISQVNLVAGDTTASGSSSSASTTTTTGLPSGSIVLMGSNSFNIYTTLGDTQIADIKVGQRATVVPAGDTTPIDAVVSQITPEATISSGVATYPVTLSVTTPRVTLFAGQSAQVSVIVKTASNVLSVPTSALHTIGSRSFVLILSHGRSKRVSVVTGASDLLRTQIVSGLSAGERVIIANVNASVPGATTGRGGGFARGGGLGGARGLGGGRGLGGAG